MFCQTSNVSLELSHEALLTLKERDSYVQITLPGPCSSLRNAKRLNLPSAATEHALVLFCGPFGGMSQIVFAQTAHQLKSTQLNQPSNRSRRRRAEVCVVLLLQETRPASSLSPRCSNLCFLRVDESRAVLPASARIRTHTDTRARSHSRAHTRHPFCCELTQP